MTPDVAIVGGGIGGSTLAAVLAQQGRSVVVLEREAQFKDRVRGENMLPWGVAAARRLGVLDAIIAAGGHTSTYFNVYAMGTQMEHRPFPQTTPSGEAALNIYHVDMQNALMQRAIQAGASVLRGAKVHGLTEQSGRWTVQYELDGKPQTVTPRLVVGADGRFSKMREWGGFTLERDRDHLRIAGTVVEGTPAPDDGTHLLLGPGFGTFIAPLGKKRARIYFVYVGAMGDRKLSGKDKVREFLTGCRATMAPSAWFDGITVTGPLAEFEGADQWIVSPGKPGLALIGDAAASTDPSWGCGLSKTMVDVETLSGHLLGTDDWNVAVRTYATDHDDYYQRLHRPLGWMTELFWSGGPDADARRARVLPRMKADPTGFPDPAGQGPFGPSDDRARRLVLGEM